MHDLYLPALRRINGAAATWLRGSPLAFALFASVAAAADLSSGRLTAQPGAIAPGRNAAAGKIAALGNGAFLYVPAGLPEGQRVPLLLLFPGTAGDGRGFVAALRPVADRGRLALLGFSPGQGNFQTVDNFFDDLEGGRANAKVTWPAPRFGRDVEQVDTALKQVFATTPIDRGHIGLFGFSHGASYAMTLGTANPQLFGSIAALSPGILVLNGDVPGGQRIFLAHGRADPVQPYRRTACSFVPRLSALGYQLHFADFPGGHELPPDLVLKAVRHFLGEKSPSDTPRCPHER